MFVMIALGYHPLYFQRRLFVTLDSSSLDVQTGLRKRPRRADCTSRLVGIVHLSRNHRRSMELTKNESVLFGIRMAFKARGPRIVNSILRLFVTHEPFESPSSRALVEA